MSDSEGLINAKNTVDREIRSFRELRELHTRLHFGLINLNRSLRVLEEPNGEPSAPFEFDASEFDGVSDELLA